MDIPIPVAVHGAAGRMGQSILEALRTRDDLQLVAALVRPGQQEKTPASLQDSRIDCCDDLPASVAPAVLIDFSVAAAFDRALAMALQRHIAFVSGTTGLDAHQRAALECAATSIPVLWSANFSLGVAVLTRLVGEAARALPQWDCEIAEAHHERKQDAPSGTALALGREVAAARGVDFDAVAQRSRVERHIVRVTGEIGFAVTRAGDIVGEHTVLFATSGERIELVHRATDRGIFARGAVTAAAWIAGRPPGRYTLHDVVATDPS
ncbi:MAG: 4-hydroxy-tetrahydrodipicolinate reductase [Dokdonella sp.]